MTGEDAELAMMALAVIIMVLIFAAVWFVFMLPMEKGLHRRRLELVQKKLRLNEERLQRERGESEPGDEMSGTADGESRDQE